MDAILVHNASLNKHKRNKRMPHVSSVHKVVELEINGKKLHKSLEIAQYTPEWQIYQRNQGESEKILRLKWTKNATH